MKIKIIYILLLTFLYSGVVELDRATQIAQNFSNSRENSFALDSIEVIEENSTVYFYVFRLQDTGFVIVSANDSAMPILGYSFDNNFDMNLPIQVEYLFDSYKKVQRK